MARGQLPDRPTLEGLEERWAARWQDEGLYTFDRSRPRSEVYSIDTPPPTVSGSLHPGHVCSYTHTDTVARFQRMRGKAVFYPMGWDDNGLNVERRVQIMLGVRCDPTLPYDPDFLPSQPPPREPVPVSRPNFIELCAEVTERLERQYHELWRTVGLSVDWGMTYTTIGEKARRTSQRAFLRMLREGQVYNTESPTLWDVDYQTAVAQAELEDRARPGAYHRLRFVSEVDGAPVEIETTRPELLPACVALVAHPDDSRYARLFGTHAVTPLFGVRVPILAHDLADPDKGSGIAMICTFGDTTDVTWWRELGLQLRTIIGRDGRLRPVTFGLQGWESRDVNRAQALYDQLRGLTVRKAQRRIVELLQDAGALIGEPKPLPDGHPVKFWENGVQPLEIVTNWQWFVRTMPQRDAFLKYGEQLRWHPGWMRIRFETWVNGLAGDWNISRQRFFGVPFPIWYEVDAEGRLDRTRPLLPNEDRLPVDPSTDVPDGYMEAQRGQAGGFAGDPDVMDTWATSSLTPQIVGGWVDDPDLFERVFPMDLRPQSHDIIRTWLFYTVARSHLLHQALPWSDAAISGFVVDPDRKKLSKSKGNTEDDPAGLLRQFGADAVRYWAASGRPGTDVAFDKSQMKVGRRLATKLLNASKFVLRLGEEPGEGRADAPLDRALLAKVHALITSATQNFEAYDYARVLDQVESFFWFFTDYYIELVKDRAYGLEGEEAGASARRTLRLTLSVVQRLLAPFLPYATEEAWSWWHDGSIHVAAWPSTGEVTSLAEDLADPLIVEVAAEALARVRRAKSERKLSLRVPATRVLIRDLPERITALEQASADLRWAGIIEVLVLEVGEEEHIEVEVAAAPRSDQPVRER